MVMNKLAYSFLLTFCLGYIANDFIHESKLSPITPAHAFVAGMNYTDLQRDPDFKKAVKSIVESCTIDGDYGTLSC
jgi:hypothetical protein